MKSYVGRTIEYAKTGAILLLTVTMLLFAALYIGGAQFAAGTAADTAIPLSGGAVPAGKEYTSVPALFERGLLFAEFAAVSDGAGSAGAFGFEPAAQAVYSFALQAVHDSLASGAEITEITEAEFCAAAAGRHVYLQFPSALPYQILYALTGEAVSAAKADAFTVERLFLRVSEDGKAILYTSGRGQYRCADAGAWVSLVELGLLAADDRLAPVEFTASGIALCEKSPAVYPVSLTRGGAFGMDNAAYRAILYLLGYNPDRASAAYSFETVRTIVEPHGTFSLSDTMLVYSAAKDSGISIADFLSAAKSELDVGLYDALEAAAQMAERLREIAPQAFGGAAGYFVKDVYRDGDAYTVIFGYELNSIEITGAALPYFAKITVQNGRFKRIEARGLLCTQGSYRNTLFPSGWCYRYAADETDIEAIRLIYPAVKESVDERNASWYIRESEAKRELETG